ncbi:MAG: ABC transporter permease subunit [Mycoplasmataceae bacterium]|nr:ABC transporter permease subunit [Mycoplasmataceae bacterium]
MKSNLKNTNTEFEAKKKKYRTQYRRQNQEKTLNNAFKGITWLFLISTIFIVIVSIIGIVVKGIEPVVSNQYSDIIDFGYLLFGGSYQVHADMVAIGYMFINTLWTSLLALLIATPFSVATALVITRMSTKLISNIMMFCVVSLSAVPSVIFGLFGSYAINGAVSSIFPFVQGGTNLSVILTLAMMITPTITLVSVNSINSVDRSIEDASLALGATKTQTNIKVTLKSAASGIFAGMILGIGRALGEATAVSLVADPINNGPTLAFLAPTQTLTITMLQGFTEVDPGSMEYSLRFTMALVLLIAIILVISSMNVLKKSSFDKSYRAKKIDYKLKSKEIIYTKVCTSGLESLSFFENFKFNRYYRDDKRTKAISNFNTSSIEGGLSFSNLDAIVDSSGAIEDTSKNKVIKADKRNSEYKIVSDQEIINDSKRKSKIIDIGFYTFASVSIAILIGIVSFLLYLGSSSLSWDFLTNGYNDEQLNLYVEDKNTSDSFDSPNLNSNQVWISGWGFGLSYETSDYGEEYISIFGIDENSPLAESRTLNESITSPVNTSNLGDSKDLTSYHDLRLTYVFDNMGNLPDVKDASYSWDSSYSWNAVENKTGLSEWLNSQSSLSLSTNEYKRGIAGSLSNTLLLIGLTMLIAIPFGFGTAFFITEFIRSKKLKDSIKSLLSTFSGIPTLIIGLIGATIFIPMLPPEGYMWAAALTMVLIIMPTIVSSVVDAIEKSSSSTKNGSLALGATKTRAFFTVTLPEVFPALVSTTIMSIGRIIGETAALIMVIGMIPGDAASLSGGATLSTHIYYLIKGTETADYAAAAGISIVIILLIGMLFFISDSIESKKWIKSIFFAITFSLFITSILVNAQWLFWLTFSSVIIYFLYELTNIYLIKKHDLKLNDLIKLKLIKGANNAEK